MDRIALKSGLWLMVADGEKALFLKNEGDTTYPNFEVVREIGQSNPPTREQGSDRPGRFNDGPSAHRSAVADTDWHKVGKVRFADEIARERLCHGQAGVCHRDAERVTSPSAPADAEGIRHLRFAVLGDGLVSTLKVMPASTGWPPTSNGAERIARRPSR